MADEDSSQEKTEEPTSKRIEKAREDGQVPRSKELNTAVILTASGVILLIFSKKLLEMMKIIFSSAFSFDRQQATDASQMFDMLTVLIYEALWGMLPIFVILLIAALVGPIGIGGWNFSTKSVQPKASRMNPLSGLKRMFSLNALVELVKGWAKVLLVGGFAFLILSIQFSTLFDMSFEATIPALAHSINILLWSFLFISLVTWLFVVLDVPYQIFQVNKKLKMSLQEIKEEFKNSEGKPEVKAKIRQIQYEMSQRRMMQDVPDADVVITNPEHFSVALKYDPESMDVPILLAKGVDEMAMKIREVAKENDILMLPQPALARSIYQFTDIGDSIPEGLYVAIAQVLAFVFQMQQFKKGKASKPEQLAVMDVPDDLKYDP